MRMLLRAISKFTIARLQGEVLNEMRSFITARTRFLYRLWNLLRIFRQFARGCLRDHFSEK